MFLISNQQHKEAIDYLKSYVAYEREGMSLREQNRFRRARLLIKALQRKRKQTK